MASTPTIWTKDAETGVRLDDRWVLQWSPDATVTHARVQVSAVDSFPAAAPIYDTLLRALDSVALGDGWAEVELAEADAAPSTTYYVSVLVSDGTPSSWATSIGFTTASGPTAAGWAGLQ